MRSALANSAWVLANAFSYRAFKSALSDPDAAQRAILQKFIRNNSDTAFGREHGLREVKTPAQFAAAVPIRDYDLFIPWIDRIRSGEQNALTMESVRRLVPTGGSVSSRKLIPYTAGMQEELNCAIAPWIFDLYRQHPRALSGTSYWSVSPASAESVPEPSRIPIGFDGDSEYLGGWRRRIVDAVLAVPSQLRLIKSTEDWRYATSLLLLRRRDLSVVSIWHPSYFSLLIENIKNNWERLLADIEDGTCSVETNLDRSFKTLVEAKPNHRRAEELRSAGAHNIRALWPSLEIISCWSDGHARMASEDLKRIVGDINIQPKGVLATEGFISIPFRGLHPLAIRSHYLEFEDQWGRIFPASELREGIQYKVILTNAGGLVRYRLNDIVEVDGKVANTPSIRFVGRAGMISDRFGEKLSEGFVSTALATLFEQMGVTPSFALLAPDADRSDYSYILFIDRSVPPAAPSILDELLSANPQYAYCRRLGQLKPVRIFRVNERAYEAYCERLQQQGQRLGDIKPSALSCLDGWYAHFKNNEVALPGRTPQPAL